MNVDNLRLAKDMKYEALYWALGFEKLNKGIFTKVYNKNLKVEINADKQQVDLGNKISIVNGETLLLTTHKSFVILECIDKLLTMGYKPSEIIIDLDNEYDIYCKDLYIKQDKIFKKLEYLAIDGATLTESLGYYRHENGETVKEKSINIELLFIEEATAKNLAKLLKKEFNQESVVFAVEELNSELI